jgi:hypothetical protein
LRRKIIAGDGTTMSQEAHQTIDDDRVMTIAEWARLNSFSVCTGRRIIAAGKGPKVIELSARRLGVRVADNRAWQATRTR